MTAGIDSFGLLCLKIRNRREEVREEGCNSPRGTDSSCIEWCVGSQDDILKDVLVVEVFWLGLVLTLFLVMVMVQMSSVLDSLFHTFLWVFFLDDFSLSFSFEFSKDTSLLFICVEIPEGVPTKALLIGGRNVGCV